MISAFLENKTGSPNFFTEFSALDFEDFSDKSKQFLNKINTALFCCFSICKTIYDNYFVWIFFSLSHSSITYSRQLQITRYTRELIDLIKVPWCVRHVFGCSYTRHVLQFNKNMSGYIL
jgi:hypothetical protein